jgi:NAD(P)-dependent dehydrogenase (short-subunit alcohol dehydrogenase family)
VQTQSFSDKVILITGGSSGIGKALVEESLRRGARVATCGRSLEKLKLAFPHADAARLLLTETDVREEAACADFVQQALTAWGGADVLINNAGISMRAMFNEVRLSVLREVMDINFWGTVQCTKYALPALMKSKGVVAGISSIAGYRGLPGRTGYSASKFAVQGFLEALRTELLHSGTHVMWVSPGFTASNIRNVARAADGSAQGETPLDEDGLMSAETCAGRILDAILARKRTVVMTGQGKLTVWLNKLFPAFADGQVYNHFKQEPGSPLQ